MEDADKIRKNTLIWVMYCPNISSRIAQIRSSAHRKVRPLVKLNNDRVYIHPNISVYVQRLIRVMLNSQKGLQISMLTTSTIFRKREGCALFLHCAEILSEFNWKEVRKPVSIISTWKVNPALIGGPLLPALGI